MRERIYYRNKSTLLYRSTARQHSVLWFKCCPRLIPAWISDWQEEFISIRNLRKIKMAVGKGYCSGFSLCARWLLSAENIEWFSQSEIMDLRLDSSLGDSTFKVIWGLLSLSSGPGVCWLISCAQKFWYVWICMKERVICSRNEDVGSISLYHARISHSANTEWRLADQHVPGNTSRSCCAVCKNSCPASSIARETWRSSVYKIQSSIMEQPNDFKLKKGIGKKETNKQKIGH